MQQGERKSKKENKQIVEKGRKRVKRWMWRKKGKKECVRKIHSVEKKGYKKETQNKKTGCCVTNTLTHTQER